MKFTKGNEVGFKKGQSGNPAGRARLPDEWREMLKANSPEAVETLASVMKDKKAPASARVAAAEAILDRAYGRPKQSVDVDANVTSLPADFWSFVTQRETETPVGEKS